MAAVATLHDGRPARRRPRSPPWPSALGVDLVVVGPEAPLVAGVADALARSAASRCFGPSAAAAPARGLQGVRQGRDGRGRRPDRPGPRLRAPASEVAAALDEFGPPYVVKDDGLAAGKGVVVTDDRDEALAHAAAVRAGGDRGVPRRPRGLAVRRHRRHAPCTPLQPAQDFKRICDGDEGPNTGGMGAYTPLPWAPEGLVDEVLGTRPPADGRRDGRAAGTPFAGLLYAGLALTSAGSGWSSSTPGSATRRRSRCSRCSTRRSASCCYGAATGTLAEVAAPRWKRGAAVAVVLAAAGYPESPSHGDVDHRPGGRRGGRRRARHPRRHRAARGRRRHRRRPGARRGRRPATTCGATPARRRTPGSPSVVLRRRPAPHRHRRSRGRPVRPVDRDDASPTSWPPATPAPTWPQIWSPEHKIVLERQLWIAVLEAQRDLGDRGARRRGRGLRGGRRAGRPRLDRGPRAGHPARREGAHRGVLRARRSRAHPQGDDLAATSPRTSSSSRSASRWSCCATGPSRRSPGWPGWPPSTRPP